MESSEIKKISPQQMIVVNAQALEHHYYTLTLLLERNIRSYNPVKISTLLVNHKDDPSLDRHVMKCVVFVDKLTAHGGHVQGNVLDLGSSKGPRFSVGHVPPWFASEKYPSWSRRSISYNFSCLFQLPCKKLTYILRFQIQSSVWQEKHIEALKHLT